MTQSDIELNRLASIPSAPSARGEGIAPPSCSDLSSTRSVTIKTNGPHPAAKLLAPMFASLWHWVRRHRFAVLSTAAIGSLITTVLGVAWLVPTWQSQDSAREAFELDQWTALKDFLEQCWERAVSHWLKAVLPGHVTDCFFTYTVARPSSSRGL